VAVLFVDIVGSTRLAADEEPQEVVSRLNAFFGAESRFEYTLIGDPVNEASRLCELAKETDGHVLASARALEQARKEEADRWREGGRGAAPRPAGGYPPRPARLTVIWRAPWDSRFPLASAIVTTSRISRSTTRASRWPTGRIAPAGCPATRCAAAARRAR
jgi:hypothetical protein